MVSSDLEIKPGDPLFTFLGMQERFINDENDIKIHGGYHHPEAYYDAAIVRMSKFVNFGKTIFPICLPDVQVIGQDHLEDKLFSVVGYASENASTIDLKELKVRYTEYLYI